MKNNNNDAKAGNKNKAVLDISALMALFTNKTQSAVVYEIVQQSAAVSVICISDILRKTEQAGLSSDFILEQLRVLKLDIIAFDLEQAEIDCNLKMHANFSLADRASIALALQLKLPVYTINRKLSLLSLPVSVHYIRS